MIKLYLYLHTINYYYLISIHIFKMYRVGGMSVNLERSLGQQRKSGIWVDFTTSSVIPRHSGWYHNSHLSHWTKTAFAISWMATFSHHPQGTAAQELHGALIQYHAVGALPNFSLRKATKNHH